MAADGSPGLDRLQADDALAAFTAMASELWQPPHVLAEAAEAFVDGCVEAPGRPDIVVSGETAGISFYFIGQHETLVVTPLSDVADNPVLKELFGDIGIRGRHHHRVPTDARLRARLTLPRIMFINPCVLENFPIPRLSLSVGLPAAYLRQHHRADVRIVDMQMGVDLDSVIAEIEAFRPDLVGMSVSYGQRDIAMDILDRVTELNRRGLLDTRLMLGNIIAASNPGEFQTRYPGLVVATGEGEVTAVAMAEHLAGLRALDDVPGISFTGQDGRPRRTPSAPVDMETIPLPAFDTLPDLGRLKGALTIELSRGCQWNICTFCPRDHKSASWKTFSAGKIVDQFRTFGRLSDAFDIKPHLFLADEEFVGGANDLDETARLTNVARMLMDNRIDIGFDAAARVDQVYVPDYSTEWHTRRLHMWHMCRQAGMDRLFLGIESGCDSQLKRYGKGIRSEHSIFAIRLLSALDIPLRFGFITFDQLMTGFKEVRDNIHFLERTDAFIRPLDVDAYGYERLYELLTRDDDFVAEHTSGKPLAASISYMLASMEVLINSRYANMLKVAEKRTGARLIVDPDHYDTNMGRLVTRFLDPTIGSVAETCQRWIDRHFGVAYTTKSLFKVASPQGRAELMNWMIAFRQISLNLLKAMVYALDLSQAEPEARIELLADQHDPIIRSTIIQLRAAVAHNEIGVADACIACLDSFDGSIEQENERLARAMRDGTLQDNASGQLATSLANWKKHKGSWQLINDPTGVEATACMVEA